MGDAKNSGLEAELLRINMELFKEYARDPNAHKLTERQIERLMLSDDLSWVDVAFRMYFTDSIWFYATEAYRRLPGEVALKVLDLAKEMDTEYSREFQGKLEQDFAFHGMWDPFRDIATKVMLSHHKGFTPRDGLQITCTHRSVKLDLRPTPNMTAANIANIYRRNAEAQKMNQRPEPFKMEKGQELPDKYYPITKEYFETYREAADVMLGLYYDCLMWDDETKTKVYLACHGQDQATRA